MTSRGLADLGGFADLVGVHADKVGGGGQLEKFRVNLTDFVDRHSEAGQQVPALLLHALDRFLHLR